MKHLRRLILAAAFAVPGLFQGAQAQEVALKTNLLSDGFLNPNVAAEMSLPSPRWTLQLSGELNAWKLSHDRQWKHWAVQPEARYWLCDRFSGSFFGIEAHGGQYNIGGLDLPFKFLGTNFEKLKDSRFQGWFVGAGVTYGYAWILGRNWNIEAEIGIGYSFTKYDQFRCAGCGKKIASGKTHNYFGPTEAAINIVYLF